MRVIGAVGVEISYFVIIVDILRCALWLTLFIFLSWFCLVIVLTIGLHDSGRISG